MICMLAFLVVWCLNTDAMASKHRHLQGNAKLKSNSDSDISVGVDLESYSDRYNISLGFEGEDLQDVKKITIIKSNGKSIILKRPVNYSFDTWAFSREDYFEDMIDDLPAGKYTIKYSPSKFGSISFNLTYDFPSIPVIAYPEDGATNVSLTATIEWESSSDDINGYGLSINGESDDGYELEFKEDLAAETTSFQIPQGLLRPNTQYEIELVAFKKIENGNYLHSILVINFTTGAE